MNEHKKALKGAKILLVGIAYKKDVKDLRESPAFEVIELLKRKEADISYYDPYFLFFKVENINLRSVKFDAKTIASFDCVTVITDHSNIDYKFLAKHSKLIVDTRNALKDIKKRSNIVLL